MPSGRTRLPTAILKLRGDRRALKRAKTEPQPDPKRPRQPVWISQRAKTVWKDLVEQLGAMGVLGKIDGRALTEYCVIWTRWRTAEEFIQKHGSTYPVRANDGTFIHFQTFPQVKEANDALEKLIRLQAAFGMTPSARARLVADVKPQETDLGKARFFVAS